MSAGGLAALRSVFPLESVDVLELALSVSGGSADAAINYLLDGGVNELRQQVFGADAGPGAPVAGSNSDDDEAEGAAQGEGDDDADAEADAEAGGDGAPAAAAHVAVGPNGETQEENDDEEHDDDADEDGDEDELYDPMGRGRPAKKLRVEPTAPDKRQRDDKVFLVRFDSRAMGKSHLELLNLNPSKLEHTCISIYGHGYTTENLLAPLEASRSYGCWSAWVPVGDVDHIWRLAINSFCFSKSTGACIRFSALSFDPASPVFRDYRSSQGNVCVQLFSADGDDVPAIRALGQQMFQFLDVSGAKMVIYFCKRRCLLELAAGTKEPEKQDTHQLHSSWKMDKFVERLEGKRPYDLQNKIIHRLFEKQGNMWREVDP